MEFETELSPHWAYTHQGIERLDRINESEFQELIVRQSSSGNKGEIFAEFVMRSGRHLYVRMTPISEAAGDFRLVITQLLDGGGFVVVDEEEGCRMIVNPKNIARWNVHPAPEKPMPTPFAWPASYQRVD